MGAFGRMVTAGIGFAVGGPLGAVISLAGGFIFKSAQPKTIYPRQDNPDYQATDGFQGTPVGGQVPVSVCFGVVQIPGVIVDRYVLGSGNNRLLAALALGEHTGINPVLTDFYVSGVRFAELSTYSPTRGDDQSWYEFFPAGESTSIHVDNNGEKPIGAQIGDTESHTSYAISVLGGGNVTFQINHYSPKAGSTQSWKMSYRAVDDPNWTTLGSDVQSFQKYVTYEEPDGCGGTSTKEEPTEGWTRTEHTFSVPAGTFYFQVELTSADHGGYVLWEDLVVSNDAGSSISIGFHKTAWILVNLIKTDEIASLNFKALTVFPYENPVDAIRFLLEHTELGIGAADEIDENSFSESRGWCSTNGREIGISFLGATYDTALRMILDSAGLYLVRSGGKFKLRPDRADTPIDTLDLKTDVLPDSVLLGATDYQQGFNRLRVKYTDGLERYTQQDVLVEDTDRIDEDGYTREKTVDLTAIRSLQVAQRRAEEIYNLQLTSNVWVKFSIGIKDAHFEPADIVRLINADWDWDVNADQQFRILTMEEIDDDEGLYGFEVVAVRHVPGAYNPIYSWRDWHPEQWVPPDEEESLPIIVIDSINQDVIPIGNGYAAQLSLSFTPQAPAVQYELWGYPENNPTWQPLVTNATGSPILYIVPEAYLRWAFRIVSIGSDGSRSAYAPETFFYPTLYPHEQPGFGGGRYGAQPYGA